MTADKIDSKTGELSEDELDSVAGGSKGKQSPGTKTSTTSLPTKPTRPTSPLQSPTSGPQIPPR